MIAIEPIAPAPIDQAVLLAAAKKAHDDAQKRFFAALDKIDTFFDKIPFEEKLNHGFSSSMEYNLRDRLAWFIINTPYLAMEKLGPDVEKDHPSEGRNLIGINRQQRDTFV